MSVAWLNLMELQVRGFDNVDWLSVSKEIMHDACLAKFTQNPHLATFLIATDGYTLVEAK